MSTNQILDKVAALKSQDEQGKKEEKKRRGAWAQVGEPLMDKHSGIGVMVSERVRGRPAYSFQIVHFDDHGANKFIQLPCAGAQRPLKEIIYLLVEKAEELIEQKRAEDAKHRPRRDHKNKDRKDKGPRKEARPVTGLSELARRDAEKKGKADEFVGKTAKKKGARKRQDHPEKK